MSDQPDPRVSRTAWAAVGALWLVVVAVWLWLRRPTTHARGVYVCPLVALFVVGAMRVPPAAILPDATLAVPVVEAATPSTIPWMPGTVSRWLPTIRAQCTGAADPELAQIVILVESAGDPDARSGAGAVGLMQIVPRWHPECPEATLTDPEANIACGCRFLDSLLAATGNAADAAYRYNSGTAQTAEGAAYRRWITGMAAERHDATSPTYDAWAAAGGARLVAAAEAHP